MSAASTVRSSTPGRAARCPGGTRGVSYRNAAADQCVHASTAGGRCVVRFQGDDYTIIGLFFRLLPDGRRALWYVLRSVLHPRDGLRMWEAPSVGDPRNGQGEAAALRRALLARGDAAAGGAGPS